eukprot:TRINITY_DN10354_c0_g1_i2.p6 TRINITY_DN10354_c0_g1~~TRINITY_DN10354_c0_g1_i2.p6  ORF type:complete len:125 (-),score=18.34 TRINITY_DN10354_c0_g1_i2:407-781(-)
MLKLDGLERIDWTKPIPKGTFGNLQEILDEEVERQLGGWDKVRAHPLYNYPYDNMPQTPQEAAERILSKREKQACLRMILAQVQRVKPSVLTIVALCLLTKPFLRCRGRVGLNPSRARTVWSVA